MKGRKTMDVEEIKIYVNSLLLHTEDDAEKARQGMATVLEQILHKTGNYQGFNYLNPRDMSSSDAKTKTPGIMHYDQDPDKDTRFDGCLEYRRIYY